MPSTINLRNLSNLCYANGATLWLAKADAKADFLVKDFFAPAGGMMAQGDMIMATAPDGASVLWVQSITETETCVIVQKAS